MNEIIAYVTAFLMRLKRDYESSIFSAPSIQSADFMLNELKSDYSKEFKTVQNLIHGGIITSALKSSNETYLTLGALSSKIDYRKTTVGHVKQWLTNRYHRPFTYEQYLMGMGNEFKGVLDLTNETLIMAAKEGWGTDKIRQAIRKNIINKQMGDSAGIANNIINRVARTEILRADSIGEAESFKESGAADLGITKVWRTSLDGRERPAHRAWNGIKANKNGVFTLRWKGNTYITPAPRLNLPAGLCINCRCALNYTME